MRGGGTQSFPAAQPTCCSLSCMLPGSLCKGSYIMPDQVRTEPVCNDNGATTDEQNPRADSGPPSAPSQPCATKIVSRPSNSTKDRPSLLAAKKRRPCGRCARRKLRCDLTKPYCKACVRVQADCPGYYAPSRNTWSCCCLCGLHKVRLISGT